MGVEAVATYSRRQAWNMASFALMGLCGVLCNVVILRFSDSATLGVFNTCFSLQVVLGQLFGAGIHYSILHFLPRAREGESSTASLLGAGVAMSLLASFVCSIAMFFVLQAIVSVGLGEAYYSSLLCLAFSLLFFPANKVLIFSLNATHRFVAYAISNALRLVLVLLALLFVLFSDRFALPVFMAVAMAELLLFVVLVCLVRPNLILVFAGRKERRDLLGFGVRALPSGVTQELNTRVDLLCLALLTSPSVAGVYSFVSTLAEGVYQLGITFRNSVDPIIAACKDSTLDDFRLLLMRVQKQSFGLLVFASCGLALGYYFVFPFFVGGEFVSHSFWPLAILLTGVMATARYIPFGGFFQQAGYPGMQSCLLLVASAVNVIVNFLLIPLIGIVGASISTVLSYVVFSVCLKVLVFRRFGVRI